MEPSTVSEPEKLSDEAISLSMQDPATICTVENPEPQNVIPEKEVLQVDHAPEDGISGHDNQEPPIQEQSVPPTNEPEDLPEDKSEGPPVDEKHNSPILWCRVELNDPEKWAKCVIFQNPSGHPGFPPPESDQDDSEMTESEDDSDQSPRIIYSNRFVDRQDGIVVADPWPEPLKLDHERGKPTGWKQQHHRPVIELVTIVRTNIDSMNMNRTYYKSTETILSDPRVAADLSSREVIIDSVRIIDAFKATIAYYPGLELLGITMTIPEPYCVFHHYSKEIKVLQETYDASSEGTFGDEQLEIVPPGSESHNMETREHLKVLCDFIERQNLKEVDLERERYDRPAPVATYRMMWLLFKPGTRVYYFSGGRAIAGVVISLQTDSGSKRPGLRSLKFWSLDFDGFKLGRRELSHIFKPFDGEKKIIELPVCPCEIYDRQDDNSLRDKLISRGERYWKFLQGAQVDYDGKLPNEAIDWRGRVIIDPTTYINYAQVGENLNRFRDELLPPVIGKVQDAMNTQVKFDPGRRPYEFDLPRFQTSEEKWNEKRREAQELSLYEEGPWAEYENIIPGDTKSLEFNIDAEPQDRKARYLLCPKDVIGFDLKTRKWLLLDVACCKEVVFNDDAVSNLVMNDDRKTVIKSLVHRYTIPATTTTGVSRSVISRSKLSQPWTADFIKHKGDGQIFLLHGGPGVGKTYTAECIAEATRRPLLSLTCGDFGTDETTLEQRLSKWFRLAEIWNAVMLLDEADVFLERRQLHDLRRNSLVSVFLRTMEYYRGILFLTTNRVGNFDDAFVSRIHSVIHYNGFSDAEREQIWQQFFKKLDSERRTTMKIDPDARKYVFHHEDMQSIQWNGREIRNAFQTAVAFADYRYFLLTAEEKQAVGNRACLEAQDFAKVSEMTLAFKNYLKSIKRDEETVAKVGGYR